MVSTRANCKKKRPLSPQDTPLHENVKFPKLNQPNHIFFDNESSIPPPLWDTLELDSSKETEDKESEDIDSSEDSEDTDSSEESEDTESSDGSEDTDSTKESEDSIETYSIDDNILEDLLENCSESDEFDKLFARYIECKVFMKEKEITVKDILSAPLSVEKQSSLLERYVSWQTTVHGSEEYILERDRLKAMLQLSVLCANVLPHANIHVGPNPMCRIRHP